MSETPSTSAMSADVLFLFLDTRRTVSVTYAPELGVSILCTMPGVLAGELLRAMLRRPGGMATPVRGTRGMAGLAVSAPASPVLPATRVAMWCSFDTSPESVAYVAALVANASVLVTTPPMPAWPEDSVRVVYVPTPAKPCGQCANRKRTRRAWRARTGGIGG